MRPTSWRVTFILGAPDTLISSGISAASVAIGLTATEFGFMVPAGDLAQVLAASTLLGGVGALLGAGIGTVVRNTGGSVTGVIVVLLILPPLAVQAVSEAASWVPGTLANVASGIDATVGLGSAVAALLVWAVVPVGLAMMAVTRRDIV